jgi:hypothetical protein
VSEAQRERLGTVAVMPITRAPKNAVEVGPRGSASGGAHGAGEGALAGADAFFSGNTGSCKGALCGLAIIFLPVFIVGGAMIGGVSGAVQAVPKDKAKQIEVQLAQALAEVEPQEALRSEVVKAGARSGITSLKDMAPGAAKLVGGQGDYRGLSEEGIDTVLEVGVLEVGLVGGGGKDPTLALVVRGAARLVDVKTNQELHRNDMLRRETAQIPYSRWSAEGAGLLKHELGRAYVTLGTSIVDEVFLIVRTH